jgi:hypothetical protein
VNEKWPVILSGFNTYEEVKENAAMHENETIILNSSSYDNLNPGWFIECMPFNTKEEALKQSELLKANKINNYVKYSGRLKRINITIDNHHLIFKDKYLLFNADINKDAIDSIIGIESAGYETYIAKAACKENFLPENLKKMRDYEFVVYNAKGEKKTAKISRFNIITISGVYWGRIQQWNQNKTSDKEKAQELFERANYKLSAVLDIEKDFNAVLAHSGSMTEFENYEICEAPLLESKVRDLVHKSEIFKKNDSLMNMDIATEGGYPYLNKDEYRGESLKTICVHGKNYVLVNVRFGGYCDWLNDGRYYSNISYIWDDSNKSFEIIDIFNHSPHYELIPLFSGKQNSEIIGFVKKDFHSQSSYFHQNEWKRKESLKYNVPACD